MKRFLTSIAIAFMCGVLAVPSIEARNDRPRSSGGGRASQTQSTPSRSPGQGHGGGQRPGGNGGSRPGGNAGSRPDGNGNHATPPGNQGFRPGNGGNHGGQPSAPSTPPSGNVNRPGGNHHGDQQPGWNNSNNQRPGNPGGQRPGWNNGGPRPGHNDSYRPGGHNPGRPDANVGHRPGGPHPPHQGHHGTPPPPPPYRPVSRPWSRPVPPRAWRMGPRAPRFSTILGISLGTAFNMSLNYLLGGGYNVASYGNNTVYLNNVSQLNFMWPEATLYYGNGGLTRGEFIYYTPGYDTYRYNNVYSSLVANYGAPINTTHLNNGMQTTWFGPDGRFVTLEYVPQYGNDGILRYYTTLSFGY